MPSIFFADRYCLTMSQLFYEQARNDQVTFEMFVRKLPPDRGYMIAAGLGTALWWLEHMEYGEREWEWLIDNGFSRDFADYLWRMTQGPRFFEGDIHAIAEGTPIAAETPIVQVTAPRIQATLIESVLLSAINHQIMVASKAARIVEAANPAHMRDGRQVWDFSLRRLHGPDAGIGVARAAYIAGCAGTATVEAGALLGIPTTGTMAHHYIMSRGPDEETRSFADFMTAFPDNHALLVDTFNVERGIQRAIEAAKETGIPLKAIRLDSGQLYEDSCFARDRLNDAGEYQTKIMASNDLDEYTIDRLVKLRAPIDIFGVGTMLGTVPDAPNVGGVYKLVEQHRDGLDPDLRYVMKFSKGKTNDPGSHQVWRSRTTSGFYGPDILTLADESMRPTHWPLLRLVMKRGRRVINLPSLDESRAYSRMEVNNLPLPARLSQGATPLELRRSRRLLALRDELSKQARVTA